MDLKQYRFLAILFSFTTFTLGLAVYALLLRDSDLHNLGMTIFSGTIAMPTHNLFATKGVPRILLGGGTCRFTPNLHSLHR